MEAAPTVTRIFAAHEAAQLFKHLDQLEVEYHKPYLRFNKPVKVPRGQASFTLDDTIQEQTKHGLELAEDFEKQQKLVATLEEQKRIQYKEYLDIIKEMATELGKEKVKNLALTQALGRSAIIKIQAAVRGFLVRRKYAKIRSAAIKIQAAVRGFLVRRQ